MKRLAICILALAVACLPKTALASTGGSIALLSAATTTGVGSQPSTGTDVRDADIIHVQVWSAAGSVATVSVQCKSAVSAPWFDCINGGIVNPSASGEYWDIPKTIYIQCNVTAYTSGSINCQLETHILR